MRIQAAEPAAVEFMEKVVLRPLERMVSLDPTALQAEEVPALYHFPHGVDNNNTEGGGTHWFKFSKRGGGQLKVVDLLRLGGQQQGEAKLEKLVSGLDIVRHRLSGPLPDQWGQLLFADAVICQAMRHHHPNPLADKRVLQGCGRAKWFMCRRTLKIAFLWEREYVQQLIRQWPEKKKLRKVFYAMMHHLRHNQDLTADVHFEDIMNLFSAPVFLS